MSTTMKLTVVHDGQTYDGTLATIRKTALGFEHFGGISATLYTDMTSAVGGYALDHPRRDDGGRLIGRAGTAYGLDQLIRILETVGAERWEDLPGRQIVVLFEEGAPRGLPRGHRRSDQREGAHFLGPRGGLRRRLNLAGDGGCAFRTHGQGQGAHRPWKEHPVSEYAPAALDELSVVTWLGEDGVPVVQIDTPSDGRFRVNVNDGPIWDQSSEEDSPAGKLAKAEADKGALVEEGLRLKNRANAWGVKAWGLEKEKDRLATAVAAVESVRDGLRRRAASDLLMNPACADVYREAADAIDAALVSPAPFVLPTKTPARLAAKDKAWDKPASFTLITDGRNYRAWRDEHNQLWPEDVILTAFTDHRVIEETAEETDRG